MAFEVTKDDIKKSQKCPPGMHIATLVSVEKEYLNEKGTTVQRVDFDTDGGYSVPYWFNDKMTSSLIEFAEAADNVKLDADTSIELMDYKGKKVCLSVSHAKDKNNKIQAQIDNFYPSDKVPY